MKFYVVFGITTLLLAMSCGQSTPAQQMNIDATVDAKVQLALADKPTSVPPTSVSSTSVPSTSVPSTSVPPTSVPPASVPSTSVPPTSVPSTSVPPTSVPPTSVPPTSVPPTSVPPTSVPPTPQIDKMYDIECLDFILGQDRATEIFYEDAQMTAEEISLVEVCVGADVKEKHQQDSGSDSQGPSDFGFDQQCVEESLGKERSDEIFYATSEVMLTDIEMNMIYSCAQAPSDQGYQQDSGQAPSDQGYQQDSGQAPSDQGYQQDSGQAPSDQGYQQDSGQSPGGTGFDQQCIEESLGKERSDEIIYATSEVMLTETEMSLIAKCIAGDKPESIETKSSPTQNVTPMEDVIDSRAQLPSELASDVCPVGYSSLAATMEFVWQPSPMQSGDVANIVFSPSDPDVVYLGIEVNAHSLYKSKDGGRTWERIHIFDHSKDLAVHPNNSDVLFLTDSHAVWKTTSGGEVKSTKDLREGAMKIVLTSPYGYGPSETSFSTVAIAPSNPSIVYVAMKGGGGQLNVGQLYRSNDEGTSFSEIVSKVDPSNPTTFNVLKVDPSDPDVVFAGSKNGVYRSADGGESFTFLTSARDVVGLDSVDGIKLIAATADGILKSDDGGLNWTTYVDGLPSKIVLRVRIASSSPNVVWATTLDGVVRSLDGGITWQDVSGNIPARNLQSIAVHPSDENVAIVATETFNFSVLSDGLFQRGQYYSQGVYRTEDGGVTWSRSDEGIIEDTLVDITAHPTRPFEVWATQNASRGMYRSRDASQTWSLSPGLLTHYAMRMVFFPSDPSKAIITSSHTGEDFGITYDSGINWSVTSEQTFLQSVKFEPERFIREVQGGDIHIHGLAIDPNDPQTIYVGTIHDPATFSQKPLSGSHIFKSSDGGTSWVEIGINYPRHIETSIREIKLDPQNSKIIYLGTSSRESVQGNGLWQSLDAGDTWTKFVSGIPEDESVNSIIVHPTESNHLLVATETGVYRSVNQGFDWDLVDGIGSVYDMEYDPTNPDVVYVASQQGVLVSKDFGLNWENVSSNLPAEHITAIAVNCNGTVVYAGVKEQGLFYAVSNSLSSIPLDTTTGVEYGSYRFSDYK